MKPLSNLQKSVLCQVARRAYEHLVARGQLAGVKLDDWRHDECERAVGKPGLRDCDNGDYLGLLSHFDSLAGEDGRALKTLMKAGTEKERQLRHSIGSVLASGGLPDEYGHSIALGKFGAPMDDLNERQLLHLLITLKARVKARARKASLAPCSGYAGGADGRGEVAASTI